MTALRIAEAARISGFRPSALRFYEDAGLLSPQRTAAGYRTYDDTALATLRFIGRAKRLGLSLEDIGDLVALLDEQRCAPVQQRLRELLEQRIDSSHRQIAELVAFTAELQRAAARLLTDAPDDPCDDNCGCVSDDAAPAGPVAVRLGPRPAPVAEPQGGRVDIIGPPDAQDVIASFAGADQPVV